MAGRAVLVGCGNIARVHARAITPLRDRLTFTFVFDADPARAAAFAEEHGLRVYPGSWDDLLADASVDAVDLCLPHHVHRALTIAALDAGKHVVCEKPIALTLEDADAMIEAARRNGRALIPVHNQQYGGPIREMKRLIDAGALGEIYLVETNGIEGPDTVNVRPWLAGSDEGGVAMAQTVHYSYICQYLLGPISRVSCFTSTKGLPGMEAPVTSIILVEFASGVLGEMTSTFAQGGGGLEHRITVYGTKGYAARVFGRLDVVSEQAYGDLGVHTKEFPRDSFAGEFTEVLRQLADAIDGKAHTLRGEEGRAAIEVIVAAYRSAASGGAVTLPLES